MKAIAWEMTYNGQFGRSFDVTLPDGRVVTGVGGVVRAMCDAGRRWPHVPLRDEEEVVLQAFGL